MKIAEKILIVLIVLGLILKFLEIPGYSLFLIFGSMFLSTFYLFGSYFFFKPEKDKIIIDGIAYYKTNSMRVFGTIATGISLSTAIVGILFKIMYWPGSNVTLLAGITYLLIVITISLIKFYRTKSDFYNSIIIRTSAFAIVSLLVLIFF